MINIMLIVDGLEYRNYQFTNEEELEKLVVQNSKKIFGEASIYIDIKTKIKSQSGIASIPDGYAFTLTKPYSWYIIEAELSDHPIYEHVVSQPSKFIIAIKNLETKNRLIKTIYDIITSDTETRDWLREKLGSIEIHKFLTDTIFEPPKLVIIIDKKTEELSDALSELNLSKHIIEFEAYKVQNQDKWAYRFNQIIGTITPLPPQPTYSRGERFFDYAKDNLSEDVLKIVKTIYDFAKKENDKLYWGRSEKSSFTFYYYISGKVITPLTVYPDGKIKLYLGWMKPRLDAKKYEKYMNVLSNISSIDKKALTKKTPILDLTKFINNEKELDLFLNATNDLKVSLFRIET